MTTSPTASQSQVSTSSATHSMPNMDVRRMFAATSLMLRRCRRLRNANAMSFVWADIILRTSTKIRGKLGNGKPGNRVALPKK